MNELDIMLIVAVAVSSLMGYFKGFVKEAMGALAVIISAAVTYAYFKRGGSLLFLSLIFILTNLGLAVVFWWLRKSVWRNDPGLSLPKRLGGVAVGFVKGMVSVLIALASLALFAGIIKVTRPDINEYVETSLLYARYRGIRPVTAGSLKDKPAPALGFAERRAGLPKEMVKEFIKIDSVKAILEDKRLIEDLNQEDYAKVMGNPKLLKLLNDPEFLKQVVALGLRQGRRPVRGNEGEK
ncbi:MAG TPA: CvpA family protein [Candidatus Omnitrophota bacterium]|nr:CvpA family protein [Candidatus Omnitrophota bacterium]